MNDIKVEIKLRAKELVNGYSKDETVVLVNTIFDPNNGIAFFPLDKRFEIVYCRQFIYTVQGKDLYEGDKVIVQGTKRIGKYETEIIKDSYGFKLKVNKTYLNDSRSLLAVIDVIGNIYDQK